MFHTQLRISSYRVIRILNLSKITNISYKNFYRVCNIKFRTFCISKTTHNMSIFIIVNYNYRCKDEQVEEQKKDLCLFGKEKNMVFCRLKQSLFAIMLYY